MAGLGQSSHAPLASLAVHWHACRGEVPPPLVGASVTLVDDSTWSPASSSSSSSSHSAPSPGKVYLFGGRLVTNRRMVNDLYILDLSTLIWTRHISSVNAAEIPQPRYFHSCDLWNGKLIVFGGMGYGKENDAELCVLNEVIAFDLAKQQWDLDFGVSVQNSSSPQPRYAHLSSITAHSLIIIGGQDMGNHYLECINVFDLESRTWVIEETFPKQRGSYRSLAVGPTWIVDDHNTESVKGEAAFKTAATSASDSAASTPFNISLLATSRKAYDEKGKERRLPIYVYTNYNFTDVKREMEVIQLHDDNGQEKVTIADQIGPMNGISLPPGLRFPMGAVLGDYLIISGTYLANTSQTFAIWTLHLPKMTWSRLDVGPLLASGSWNRGLLWPKQGKLLVFGNRNRDLVSDYNHRQTNWDHIFFIELEAWGITQPPQLTVSSDSLQLGLQKLVSSLLGSLQHSLPNQKDDGLTTSLSLGNRGDFEIICSDGMKLGCDRIILEKRWSWFANKMQKYQSRALTESRKLSSQKESLTYQVRESTLEGSDQDEVKLLPRITPRQLYLGEPAPVVMALLIYFYTRCICTSTQRHPAIVASLLIVSTIYDMDDLQIWAKHAAHVSLSTELAAPLGSEVGTPTSASTLGSETHYHLPPLERHRLAIALYEAATISGLEALQIRALRTVMSVAKWVQRSNSINSRSLSIQDLDSTREGSYTPTTGALQSDFQSLQSETSPSTTTRIASPASRKRTSMATASLEEYEADEPVTTATAASMTRKLSKAERMLGISEADIASSPNTLIANRTDNSRGTPSITRNDRASSQSLLIAPSIAATSSLTAMRRPSAPGLVSSQYPPNSLLHPRTNMTTTDYSNLSNNRKRFSLFGRATDKSPSPEGNQQVDNNTAEELRTSFEHQSINRGFYRTNIDTTTDGSLASLQEAISDSSSSSSFPQVSLPPPALSEKDMKRLEKGKLSTVTRLKPIALKSIDTTYTPYDTVPNNNNGSINSLSKSTLAASVPKSSYNNLQNTNKLNDQELKALYSIY